MVDNTRRMFLGAATTFGLFPFSATKEIWKDRRTPIVVSRDKILDVIFTRVSVTGFNPPLQLYNGVCYVSFRDRKGRRGHLQFPEVNHTHRITDSIHAMLFKRPPEDELLHDAYVLLIRAAMDNPRKVESPTHQIIVSPNDDILEDGGIIEVNVNSRDAFLFFESDNGLVGLSVMDNTKIAIECNRNFS